MVAGYCLCNICLLFLHWYADYVSWSTELIAKPWILHLQKKKNTLQANTKKISLTLPFWVMHLTREKKMTAVETAQRRDLEAPEVLPPSHTDSSGWVPWTKRTVFWIRVTHYWGTDRERRGLEGENREIGGNERARKEGVPAMPPECPSQIPLSYILLPFPAAGQFLPQ